MFDFPLQTAAMSKMKALGVTTISVQHPVSLIDPTQYFAVLMLHVRECATSSDRPYADSVVSSLAFVWIRARGQTLLTCPRRTTRGCWRCQSWLLPVAQADPRVITTTRERLAYVQRAMQ